MINPSSFDDQVAYEKGRLLAAQSLAHDPIKRKECEDKFGKEYVMRRLPEAYRSGFGRVLDRIFPFKLQKIG